MEAPRETMRNAKCASSQGQHNKCTQEDVQCKSTTGVKPETSSARTRKRMGGVWQGLSKEGNRDWHMGQGAQQVQAVLKEHDMHLGFFLLSVVY